VDRKQFGKGSLEGVIFAESAQNAKEGGQAIPTLAFGVPGGLAWVFILFAMLSYGIAPGPQMLGKHADITIMLAVSFGIGNLLVALIGLALTGQLAKLTTIPYVVIGAVIIPISFLSAFQAGDGWFGILVLLVFTPVGLAMKAFQWPRAPLILGFILGGVVELNLQSALSAYGALSLPTRPITVALLVIIVVTTVVLLRLNRQDERSIMAAIQTGDIVSQASSTNASGPARKSVALALRGPWKLEHWFALFIVGVVGLAVWASFDFAPNARFLPLITGGPIVAMTLFYLAFMRNSVSGDIMDIGLRSLHIEGAAKSAALITGFIALFLLLATTIGLKYSSIIFAVLFPLVMMDGKTRWIASLTAGLLVASIAIGLLDSYMGVFWPDQVVWHWIAGLF
jgi:hypothetical protein